MRRNRQLINRMNAIVLITFGVVFGAVSNGTKLCLGDNMFLALGLPIWSNRTSGIHYPTIAGAVSVLIGVGVLNSTLQEKIRLWVWVIAFLILVI